ncbi:MAG: Maf family protein [Leptolinea sp.]
MFDQSKIVLASNSPRRKELISLTGWIFSTSPADIDETPRSGEAPENYVTRLAKEKAAACRNEGLELILAADTIVVDANQIMGKPLNEEESRRMLVQLRGHTHQVMTAVVLFDSGTGRLEEELCLTHVPMRTYSDAEIDTYIASGDPFDKAGAYAIQHSGFHPVASFHGCFASVMGLPLCHVKRMAKSFEKPVADSMVTECQRINQYTCSIFQQVAHGAEIG